MSCHVLMMRYVLAIVVALGLGVDIAQAFFVAALPLRLLLLFTRRFAADIAIAVDVIVALGTIAVVMA